MRCLIALPYDRVNRARFEQEIPSDPLGLIAREAFAAGFGFNLRGKAEPAWFRDARTPESFEYRAASPPMVAAALMHN